MGCGDVLTRGELQLRKSEALSKDQAPEFYVLKQSWPWSQRTKLSVARRTVYKASQGAEMTARKPL